MADELRTDGIIESIRASIVMARIAYDEAIEQGFKEDQAFEISRTIIGSIYHR